MQQSTYQKPENGTSAHVSSSGNITEDSSSSTLLSAEKKSKLLKWGLGVVVAIVIAIFFLSSPKNNKDGSSSSKNNNLSETTGDDLVSNVISATGGGGGDSSGSDSSAGKTKELRLFDDFDRYVLEDYDSRPTFASFLPGIAGLYGKPVWAFYVNRGQGIATFGTESKDYPMLEFNAANKAYQLTPYIGFRTFIQGKRDIGKKSSDESFLGLTTTSEEEEKENGSFVLEPFAPSKSRILLNKDDELELNKPKRVMYIGTNEMEVKEVDVKHGILTNVTYIVLPNEDFSSLVRRTTITNIDASLDLTLGVLDGVAKMEPAGGKLDWGLKNMGRTLEGWMGVYHADETLDMPFFRMSTEASDDAAVKIEEEGHYVLSFVEGGSTTEGGGETPKLLPIVYDPNKVFGHQTPLEHASALEYKSVSDIVKEPQYGDAKTACAFSALEDITLKPGESVTIVTFYGKAKHIREVPKIVDTITENGYVKRKFDEARELVSDLTSSVETKTADHLFNGAVKQMFLDNALRGGLPFMLGDVDEKARMSNLDEDSRVKAFHAFSRIHGDLERDYNAFSIIPTYFSQGPGNYRDVAQNRRNDIIFQPRMASFDVRMFLSFIQADAYEPLTVESIAYLVENDDLAQHIANLTSWSDPKSNEVLTNVLKGGAFRPGQLFDLVEQLDIRLDVTPHDFINFVLANCNSTPMAVYGSGYWGDHWDYYMDLINNYLSIYPDGEQQLMYGHELKYFFSTATVKPRSEKYVVTLTFDASANHVIQLDATEFDEGKAAEQEEFRDPKTGLTSIDANWQRTNNGEAFTSTPIAKLFLLGAIKFATRDAYGMGIEYEGGRPGWNDAMNGLVGMVGSGMPETYELKLLLEYVLSVVSKYRRSIIIPIELNTMITKVNEALDELTLSGYKDDETLPDDVPLELFIYWDKVATAREEYRVETNYYFSGNTTKLHSWEVTKMVQRWLDQIDIGIKRAMQISSHGYDDDGTSGVPACYFSYEVTDWELNGKTNKVGLPLANAKAMKVGKFPLFLEGPVRYMKTITNDKDELRDVYTKVLKSGLRDEELKMYTVSANLKGQSFDMGRMMAFAPGWLENQSVWLHMSYKYYLELIRGKLYTEFFNEMKGGGMLPYMNPHVYGRSLMECSSFLASSAFKDPNTVGRGFSARLSGSTAEFLSMWVLMFIGPNPFFLDENGDLGMQLVPALPVWLFKVQDDESEGADDADDVKDEKSLSRRDEQEEEKEEEDEYMIQFKIFSTIVVTYHNTEKKDLFGLHPKKYEIAFADGTVEWVNGPTIPSKLAQRIRRVYGIGAINCWF